MWVLAPSRLFASNRMCCIWFEQSAYTLKGTGTDEESSSDTAVSLEETISQPKDL